MHNWSYAAILGLGMMLFSCNQEKQSDVSDNLSSDIKHVQQSDSTVLKTDCTVFGFLKESMSANDQKARELLDLVRKGVGSSNKTASGETETYLGSLLVNSKQTNIFTRFYTVQAAIEKHGHSEIVLVDADSAEFYNVEMSENLPAFLNNDRFGFITGNDTVELKLDIANGKEILFTK